MEKILIVGQTPPPHHGQAVMIQKIVEGSYPGIKLYHARMIFSHGLGEVGRFRTKKLISLLVLISRIYWLRVRHDIRVMYYPPAGPYWVPVLRDVVILAATRWLFARVIFHFHACGVSELCTRGPLFTRLLLKLAYFRPDAAVRSSHLTINDGHVMGAKREFIIPCGIEDEAREYLTTARAERTGHGKPGTVLYVGLLSEDKGVLVLLDAVKRLKERGCFCDGHFVGRFATPDFERRVVRKVVEDQLEGHIRFSGVLTGRAKAAAYAAADIFCFPSHHPTETFGVVNIEALSFQLPIIATRWRAAPDIVDDGANGFLVPTRDPEALANRLEELLRNPELRGRMGRLGRAKFEHEFTLERYRQRFGDVFHAISWRDGANAAARGAGPARAKTAKGGSASVCPTPPNRGERKSGRNARAM
jgi:glycosyltransferase involved in cell wall biosynthesis